MQDPAIARFVLMSSAAWSPAPPPPIQTAFRRPDDSVAVVLVPRADERPVECGRVEGLETDGAQHHLELRHGLRPESSFHDTPLTVEQHPERNDVHAPDPRVLNVDDGE